ncbi:fatty acid desaturase [Chachezhania antarctica]|uniref:fatty acid desaturase n=1 Tax=Chachezhania antarctica TaxID=2340860 RepID=UPI000EAF28EA|nr:fatty acid desaturase [Chachezhania antarctica]
MDHTAFLSDLPADTKAALSARSNRAGLRHLAVYMGALALTTALIAAKVPFWPLCLLLQGVLLVFLFTLSHECTHQTPFRSPWISDLVGHAIAPLLCLPFTWFRYFHLAHHRFTNDPERDPELAGGGRPETLGHWLLYLSGWLYWRSAAVTLSQNAFGTLDAPYLPPRRHTAIRREARILLAVYVGAALSLVFSPLLFWIWLLPVVIGQPVLRLYLLAEHGLCPPVADMFENTRTTFTGRIVRFLAWNMPYHAEHHAYPSVPFHKLPTLHDLAQPHLKSTSPGYAAFTRSYLRRLRPGR